MSSTGLRLATVALAGVLVMAPCRAAAYSVLFASADEPTLRGSDWIDAQWEAARPLLRDGGQGGALLVLDEVQKVPHWSEAVKRLWDADTRARRPLKIVLLGSAPVLVQRGLTESLAGRFEIVHLPHWTWAEMHEAFDWRGLETRLERHVECIRQLFPRMCTATLLGLVVEDSEQPRTHLGATLEALNRLQKRHDRRWPWNRCRLHGYFD